MENKSIENEVIVIDDNENYIRVAVDLDCVLIKNEHYTKDGKRKVWTWWIKKKVPDNLWKLHRVGFRFHVITARTQNSLRRVKEICEKIEIDSGIKFESITCTTDQEKSSFASKLGCKFIIDDQYRFIKESQKYNITGIHFTYLCDDKHDGEHFGNWDEVYNYLIQYK
jgi:hypothetical protein